MPHGQNPGEPAEPNEVAQPVVPSPEADESGPEAEAESPGENVQAEERDRGRDRDMGAPKDQSVGERAENYGGG